MASTSPFRRLAPVVALALPLLGAACSGSDDAAEPSTTPPVVVTEEPRFECTDPAGDVEDAYAPAGTTALADPAGIDLTEAVVERTDDTLEVSFTAAGDVDGTTTAPAFILFRGEQAGVEGSFEVQALRGDDGVWALYLIEYLTNVGERARLAAPVSVAGSTVSFTVPLADLPPLTGTKVWSFGSYDGDRSSVADLDAGPTTTTSAPAPVAPEPSTGYADLCTPFDDAATTSTTAG